MISRENTLFIALAGLVLAIAVAAYAVEYTRELDVRTDFAKTTVTQKEATITTQSTQATTIDTVSTTMPEMEEYAKTTFYATSTSTTITPAPTTTAATPDDENKEQTDYISQYRNKGYRQAYMNITFLCPSCVPAVSSSLRNQMGVIAKSMSYRQRISWVIYDPGRVGLERVFQLSTANGEGVLINDTEI